MPNAIVMKFGGTSLGDPDAMRRLQGIVGAVSAPRVVVVSALSGVTDALVELGTIVGRGELQRALDLVASLESRHLAMADALVPGAGRTNLRGALAAECQALRTMVEALAALHEYDARSRDAFLASGELLSSRLAAAVLQTAGIPAEWVDARQLLVTSEDHGRAQPLMEETRGRCAALVAPLVERGRVPVIGGFVGATRDGVTTTLGRGGSDYSAAIVGAALDAAEIQIWTDVDGMLTVDPRVVPGGTVVPELTYAEAAELAYFGAKVLHPATILPAVERDIPVCILNSRRPGGPGTRIGAHVRAGEGTLRAVACKRHVTVIDITSTRMLMAYGFLQKVFEVFARFETPVDVVTTSEVSVSVTVDDGERVADICRELSGFATVSAESGMALVCAVGERLRSDHTLVTRVLAALDGLALRMISQAGARRNVTVVLRGGDLAEAMGRLHRSFFGSDHRAAAEQVA
jgi:aspartate kinase